MKPAAWGRVERWVVGPGGGALGVAVVGFVAPEDSMPVRAAGLDAVFVDEVPDDLFEGDAAGGEMEAGEGSFERVVVRRGEDVEVAAGIGRRGAAVVLVDKDRLWVVNIMAGLVAKGRTKRLEARRACIWAVVDPQRHLYVEVHPVAQERRLTYMRLANRSVADDQLVGAQPHIA